MDRNTAAGKIKKLQALAADTAATPGEAATARRMADRLKQRHGIRDQDIPRATPPPRRPNHHATPQPAAGVSFFGSREAFIKAFADAMNNFDINTGEVTGPGVTVHHYRNRGNWRIELDI